MNRNPLRLAIVVMALLGATSQARAATYAVTARFQDGGMQGMTVFSGSFDWDGSTVSHFHGLLSASMWAWDDTRQTFTSGLNGTGVSMPSPYLALAYRCTVGGCTGYAQNDAPLLDLGHQLATSVEGEYVTVSAFRVASTDVVWGGGYDVWGTDPATDPNNAMAHGFPAEAARNDNAFFTLVFDRNDPADTSRTWNRIVYADMTRFGMMGPMVYGWGGMTGHADHGAGAGSMDGEPLSLTISPVPEPETYATFLVGLGLVGFLLRRRRAG